MEEPDKPLRRGWTTGACAAAASKAACAALVGRGFPDPVEIALPGGQRVAFALARAESGDGFARCGIIKDAGDDPDVTHGALIVSTVRRGASQTGISFRRGQGVGLVTRPGLAIPPGEPAINPVPRRMITDAIREIAGEGADIEVEISVPDGDTIAQKTLNGRLGIVGGISILGTTGIVIPYSCSSWIHSIHRGIDVARAMSFQHVAGSTGNASETAVQKLYDLHEVQLIDMGDFVGGMLKYLRDHPVPRVTIAGGVAKMTKLAQGMLDLHSKRGSADLDSLAEVALRSGAADHLGRDIRASNTVAEAFELAKDIGLGDAVASAAHATAVAVVAGSGVEVEILVFDREGNLTGAHPPRPLNRR